MSELNTTNPQTLVWEKVFAMVTLGLGSFLSGMLPAIISERNRQRFPLTISLMLCFGAGILLATALVHILPDVRKQMNSNYAEIAICGGFFIIYFVDEVVHYFFGEHSTPTTISIPSDNGTTNRGYGAIDERSPLRPSNANAHSHSHHNGQGHDHHHHHQHDEEDSRSITSIHEDESNSRACHTAHEEPHSSMGLFVALSLHSAIEGVVIGVENKKVLVLLGAVACHKFVMGFCLGLEFQANPHNTKRSHLIGISIFALGAILGIATGMLIVQMATEWSNVALSIIQALAGGTLFYVTVCEVIPREKARWHQNRVIRAAGLAQFVAVVVGFTTMCLIILFVSDDE